MISEPFVEYISPAETLRSCELSVIIREGRMSQLPPGRAPACWCNEL